MNHAPACCRRWQYGSSNFRKRPSMRSSVPSKTRCSVAGLLIMLQAAVSFVPQSTWPQPSTSSTGTRLFGRYGCSVRGRSKEFDAAAPSGRSNGKSLTWSPRSSSKLWIAREDQQQQQRRQNQNRDHHDGPPPSANGSNVLPVVGDIRRVNMDALRVRKCVEQEQEQAGGGSFVDLFRACAPYIRAHLGAVMVIHMGGEVLEYPNFLSIMDDLGLLRLLGARLVIVSGARPQVSTLLKQAGIKEEFRDDLRVTSKETLKAIKAAAGFVRIEVESALGRGARGGNTGGFHVAGGNYFSAKPIGVRDGLDYGCTGEVRKVEADRIRAQLDDGGVVHLTCIGYSGSGEVFNVNTVDLAAKCAAALGASKLVYIADGSYLEDTLTGEVIKSMRLSEARLLLARYKKQKKKNGAAVHSAPALTVDLKDLSPEAAAGGAGGGAGSTGGEVATAVGAAGEVPATATHAMEQGLMKLVEKAVMALTEGVARAHVVPPASGALLQELYTRDGAGLLISRDIYDGIRPANPGDIPGIREIIGPLEEAGVLVQRPPEQLEADILRNEYFVITRDESVLGVAFFKRYGQDHAEVGCMAIHRNYRKRGWGEAMLSYLERVALASSVKHLFVLSTVTMQWFVERGFEESQVSDLPPERRKTYNWERMSKIYHKTLGGGARAVDAEELLWDVRGMA